MEDPATQVRLDATPKSCSFYRLLTVVWPLALMHSAQIDRVFLAFAIIGAAVAVMIVLIAITFIAFDVVP